MAIAMLKLADLAFRFVFVLGALYSLPPRAAGQFGSLNALIAYYVFFVGFERYGVIQRKIVAGDAAEIHRVLRTALHFFAINHAAVLPVLLVVASAWLKIGATELSLLCVIAIGEHIAVDSYRIALVAPRFRALLLVAVGRSALITTFGIVLLVVSRDAELLLTQVLWVWALGSLAGIAAFALAARRAVKGLPPIRPRRPTLQEFLGQYGASAAHFGIGLLALCSGQIDRIVVGAVSNLETAGFYFKNLFVASAVYQATTVILQNRLLPDIYREIALGSPRVAAAITARASRRLAVLYGGAMLIVGGGLYAARMIPMVERQGLQSGFVVILLGAFMLRANGDLNCVLMNAASRERYILTAHGATVFVGVVANTVLTRAYGVGGTVASMMIASASLIAFTQWFKVGTLKALLRSQ
jgi:hypothetical protein